MAELPFAPTGAPSLRVIGGVPVFDFFARPRRFSQEFQAGRDRRIVQKAANGDPSAHGLPSVALNQVFQNHFERDPMQGIGSAWRRFSHGMSADIVVVREI